MNSEFEKLPANGRRKCLTCGYNQLYRDYPSVAAARAEIDRVMLDKYSTNLELRGAIRALRNTCIVATIGGWE